MSKRTLFLSGSIIAIVTLVAAVLSSQVLFNQPSELRSPVVNAQPNANNPAINPAGNPANPQQQVTPSPASSTLSVSGSGRAFATPDIARMTIGVEAMAPTVGKAVGDVNAKQAAIIAKLKSLGIADKDIQTTSFNVSIDRSKPPTPGSETPTNYHASNTAQVTIRKTDQLSTVLEAAVNAGANNIFGVQLSLSDPSPMMSDARSKAVADAKAKADALAKLAGVKLGRIINISEGFIGGVPQPFFAEARVVAAGPFETGELQVTVTVNVVFAIEPQ